MYLEFYGLKEKPFNLTPDPRFIFLSRNHREAFAHLVYGIKNRVGFMALTGEVGTGKTTVLRALLSQLDPETHRLALVFNPCLSPPELLRSIAREFGIPSYPFETSNLLNDLNIFLLQQNLEGRTVILVIDEGQDLEPAVLEQIRLISNLETDREKLIQIVLAGQPELAQTLRKKEMRQLAQRITVQYHLQPMDFEDTVEYIDHRIQVAGGRAGKIFSRGALRKIYGYSHGLPRLTNVVCDRSLLVGYTRNTERISARMVAAGIRDMKKNMATRDRRRRLLLVPALGIMAGLLAAGIYLSEWALLAPFQGWEQVQAEDPAPQKYPLPSLEFSRPSPASFPGEGAVGGPAGGAFPKIPSPGNAGGGRK